MYLFTSITILSTSKFVLLETNILFKLKSLKSVEILLLLLYLLTLNNY